ncbi:E3 ubiquitin-protein ligase TM129 [Anthonomus grandis grandis]|uniref:E3 ubiquitin-protein ligase TM129 n=1 Tax=Anthonomus grandis grandis TaxID=2921223 RepID=UPI0021668A69|nr:E3 ubiquitin-protein ligase TM129 [Anthonomus grandis grandis]
MSSEVAFNLFYLLICFAIIYPHEEFISTGLTIQNCMGNFLGSEKQQFIRYHMKKSMLNLFVYSCLPLVYIILLFLLGFESEFFELFTGSGVCWRIFAASSVAAPFIALFELKRWTESNHKNHPIVKQLTKCCNNNNDWEAVASDIENEYRRLGSISFKTNPIIKIVVTENWLLKVTPLTIFLTHQSDATLCVNQAQNYQLSHMGASETQFLNIEVKCTRADNFTIRINSVDFKDLEDRLARSINILPDVRFHKTVTEQFLEVFKQTVRKNPKYNTDMELDQCIGCLQANPQIKLQKQCQSTENQSMNCTNCFCKPMWCLDCIGKWFMSKQDPELKNQWLASKCTCPMCRATFCLLDVSLLGSVEE